MELLALFICGYSNAQILNAGLFSVFSQADYDFDGRYGITGTSDVMHLTVLQEVTGMRTSTLWQVDGTSIMRHLWKTQYSTS